MTTLSKAQNNVIDTFYRWENCQLILLAGGNKATQAVLNFWQDNGEDHYRRVNTRTAYALIGHGVLVLEGNGTYKLAPGWQPKKQPAESKAAQ